MKNIFYMTLMICTLFFLQSCSKKEESTAAPASQTMTDSTGASVSLDGTYSGTVCSAEKESEDVVLSGNDYTYTYSTYIDDACATVTITYITNRTYVTGSSTSASNGETANKITMTRVTRNQTLFTDAKVTEYNDDSAYGFSDWVKGTTKVVTGLDDDGGASATTAAGTVAYDLWYVLSINLQFGNDSGVDSTVTYPILIDGQVWTKQ